MTEATIDTTANTAAAPLTPKPQQTATITLTGANGTMLQLVAERRATGARSYAITTDAAKQSSRGMTELHATFEAAKAATEKMATKAEKQLGWKRREARRAFAPKPDMFTTLPAAPAAPKAAKK